MLTQLGMGVTVSQKSKYTCRWP